MTTQQQGCPSNLSARWDLKNLTSKKSKWEYFLKISLRKWEKIFSFQNLTSSTEMRNISISNLKKFLIFRKIIFLWISLGLIFLQQMSLGQILLFWDTYHWKYAMNFFVINLKSDRSEYRNQWTGRNTGINGPVRIQESMDRSE